MRLTTCNVVVVGMQHFTVDCKGPADARTMKVIDRRMRLQSIKQMQTGDAAAPEEASGGRDPFGGSSS